ncbi:MAG TPA: hypothetical protein VF092_27360 [Longimicrobium sp.]
MDNLTLSEKLIREHKAEPLEGHTVVVLERVGESGEKFHSLLEPGSDRVGGGWLRALLGRSDRYFAFAVDASKARPLRFTEHVEMAERAHDFDLHFTLWYRVSDAQLLVAARDIDPLLRVQTKVAEVVTEEIAQLPWAEVWHSFRTASEFVVSGTLPELKTFARDYGITLTSLRLREQLPREATAVERKIHETREKGRYVDARRTVGRELKNRESDRRRENAARDGEDRADEARRERQDTVTRTTTETIGKLIATATSMEELAEIHASLGTGEEHTSPLLSRHRNGSCVLGPGNRESLAALPAGSSGLPGVLSDLVTLTDQLGLRSQRCRIQGALLHVVASVLAEDAGQVTARQADHAREAQQALAEAPQMAPGRFEALQDLADPQQLRARLHSP